MPKLDYSDCGPTWAPFAPSPPSTGRWGGRGPMSLERVSPAEELHGPIFGLETPYLATPTGFGEWVPVLPGEPIPTDVAVIDPRDV